ncbi:MAG: hypothetical protein ACFFFG_15165 [Candidatus Thorarchaeota archaeon]
MKQELTGRLLNRVVSQIRMGVQPDSPHRRLPFSFGQAIQIHPKYQLRGVWEILRRYYLDYTHDKPFKGGNQYV